MPNKSSGFTLIELLIALSIIAIVFGVIIGSTVQIQKSSRDAKRQSDLRVIQSALQQYFADQTYFPSNNIAAGTTLTNCIGTDFGGSCPIAPATLITYIKAMPKDPSTSPAYCYIPLTTANALDTESPVCNNTTGPKCNYYRLYARLENNSGASTFSRCPSPNTQFNYTLTPN